MTLVGRFTRNKRLDRGLYQRTANGDGGLSNSTKYPRNADLAKKSTVVYRGNVYQLFSGKRQVYCGEVYDYSPRDRFNKRLRKMVSPPVRQVRIKWPMGKPGPTVEVEDIDSGFSFQASLKKLGFEWLAVG